jgi:hypothetical protein
MAGIAANGKILTLSDDDRHGPWRLKRKVE